GDGGGLGWGAGAVGPGPARSMEGGGGRGPAAALAGGVVVATRPSTAADVVHGVLRRPALVAGAGKGQRTVDRVSSPAIGRGAGGGETRSEEHTSELQSREKSRM